MLGEIGIALDSTLRHGFDRSHCLCHGDLGNAELFLQELPVAWARWTWPAVLLALAAAGAFAAFLLGGG